jgi:hypothetical protein
VACALAAVASATKATSANTEFRLMNMTRFLIMAIEGLAVVFGYEFPRRRASVYASLLLY